MPGWIPRLVARRGTGCYLWGWSWIHIDVRTLTPVCPNRMLSQDGLRLCSHDKLHNVSRRHDEDQASKNDAMRPMSAMT